jgi:MFS family permease
MDHWQSDASLPEREHVKHVEHTAVPLEAAAFTPVAAAVAATELATTAATSADVTQQLRPGRWQYLGLSLAFLAVSAVWGLITGISAIVAMAWAPIAGLLSDRTRSRLGRRNIWVLFGAIGTALLLLLLGQAATIPLVIALWCAVQITTNSISSPLSAVIPERFPVSRRGTISALAGIGALLGTFLGVAIGGLTRSLTVGWLTVGGCGPGPRCPLCADRARACPGARGSRAGGRSPRESQEGRSVEQA